MIHRYPLSGTGTEKGSWLLPTAWYEANRQHQDQFRRTHLQGRKILREQVVEAIKLPCEMSKIVQRYYDSAQLQRVSYQMGI